VSPDATFSLDISRIMTDLDHFPLSSTMSHPTISHRPIPLLSPATSLSSIQAKPVFDNYQLPASPPFHFDTSPTKSSRIFQQAAGGQDDLPKNVYVLNLPLDMSQ
jgi:hypothetical protein